MKMGAGMDGDDHLASIFRGSVKDFFAPHHPRLSDKILSAFHQACDEADYQVADHLLRTLEMMLTRQQVDAGPNNRSNIDSLVEAHERLWQLRHPI
jgi:hypothetical protein